MATSYYFWGHQRVGLLRGREKIVYSCMPLFLPYFLSSFYHFLSFTPFLFLLLVSYSLVVGCSPFGLFFAWIPLSRFLLLSYYGFFPLGASAPLGPLLSVFFSLPSFSSPIPFGPLFLPWLPSFYSELIQWDFSLLPLGLHQLFLVCCGHPFKITHRPIGCPCHCLVHVCYTITHCMTKFPFFCSCCILLPLGSHGYLTT